MADNERDARLILRAEDRATKTFDAVAKSIANVREALQQQTKAAEGGQGSLDDLQKSYKALQQAGDDLVKQQAAIKSFQKTSKAADRTATRIDAARKALEDYQGKLSGQDKVTDAQTAKLERLTNAVAKLTDTYNEQSARVDKARDTLTGLGLAADKTEEQLTATAESAKLVAQGLTEAKGAIDNYDAGLRQAASAAEELAVRNATLDKASKLGIDTSQVTDIGALSAAIQLEEIRLNELAVAEKAEAAASKERRAALVSTTKEILSGNPALEEQFNLLEQLASEEKAANAFKAIGAEANTAEQYLAKFGSTTTEAEASLTRLADEVRKAVTPTAASVQMLDEALAQVDASATLAADKQKQRVSAYQDSLNSLAQSQAALVKQASVVDAFQAQEKELARLETELGAAATRYEELRTALASGAASGGDAVREFQAAERELTSLGAQAQAAGTKLEQLDNLLKRAGIDSGDLQSAIARLNAGAAKSGPTFDQLSAKVGGGGKGFLGLKPFELQNLSYQINDVFTSLASGISPTQTLAQQGGQIVQIFPGVLSTFVRLLPILAPIGLAFGVIAYNISQANKEASAIRGFDAFFSLSGNAAGLSAKQFGDAQVQLEKLGASATDAKEALLTFIRDGLDPAGLDDFVKTAQTIATVTGVSLPEAATKLGDAYTKGFGAISELNDLLGGPLNDAQLQNIKNELDAGDATDAHTQAQEAFTKAAQEAADKSKSDWQKQVDGLKTAFKNLNDEMHLGDVAYGVAVVGLKLVAGAVSYLTDVVKLALAPTNLFLAAVDKIRGKTTSTAVGISPGKTIKSGSAQDPFAKQQGSGRQNDVTAGGQKVIDGLKEQQAETQKLSAAQRIQLAQTKAIQAAEAAGASQAEINQAKSLAASIEQTKINKENEQAAKKAQSADDKAARAAEARQNKIDELNKSLQNLYTQYTPANAADPYAKLRSDATKAVNDIRDKFAKLAKLGVTTVDGKTEKDFEDQVAAYTAIAVQQQQLVDSEKTVNALLEDRKTKLAAIEDAVASGAETPLQGLEDSKKVLDDTTAGIRSAAEQALALAQALNAAHPSPELTKQIADIQRQLQSVSATAEQADLKTITDKDIKNALDKLSALTTARDEFVRLQNQLVTAGVKTQTEAQDAITAAYNSSTPVILDQVQAVQDVIDKGVSLGTIGPQELAKYQAQLSLTAGETHHLSDEQTKLLDAYNSGFTQGFSTFFDSLGSSIAGAINGTESLGDVFKDIGNAALSFAATFTKAIADAIIQILALQAAKALLGAVGNAIIPGFHSGGVIGSSAPTFARKVPATVFAGAVRYHTGGMVGLAPDEVPAILQKGEEVVTAADPRNRANGGLAPAVAMPDIKIVNTLDAGEFISQGANTLPGQKAILNVLRSNPAGARAALGLS